MSHGFFTDFQMMSHEFSMIFTDFSDILQILDYVSRNFRGFADDVSRILTDFSDILQILYDVSPIFTDF